MRTLTLVFHGVDGEAAKARAAEIRKGKATNANLRDASAFVPAEIEPCDAVEIMKDVKSFDRAILMTAYGEKVAKEATPLPPPPPPPPVDPLADLPANWPQLPPARLREIATAVSGRTPEDKKQAVEMIEQALAARIAK